MASSLSGVQGIGERWRACSIFRVWRLNELNESRIFHVIFVVVAWIAIR